MKKFYLVLLWLLAISVGVGMPAYAASAKNVVGSYSMKFTDKVWLEGEGTESATNYGNGTLNSNKTFNMTVTSDGHKTYSGKYRVKKNKLIIKKTKTLRSQIENQVLKPWLIEYVNDEGGNITNINFSYSTYKITKANISQSGPNKVKIILKGRVSGNVTDMGYVSRAFKYSVNAYFQ